MHAVDHTKNIIEVSDLSFAYRHQEPVLDHVSLTIHEGDYVGIVGSNGSGKTTLLKSMLGLLAPQSGEVKLFGQPIETFGQRWKIGYVPQHATHFETRFPATVEEVVLMGRYAKRGIGRWMTPADRHVAHEALVQVDMADAAGRLIGDLSGGQQQRVFIARALAARPEVIFLDEPTTGIDTRVQDEFYALLRRLNQEFDITLVLVSHDIERVAREVMHIACIDRTLTCFDTPEAYFSRQPSL
jgi:zinc transport system ATP-binding protein